MTSLAVTSCLSHSRFSSCSFVIRCLLSAQSPSLLLPPSTQLPQPLLLLPPPLVLQIPLLQPLQLLCNLIPIVWYLVRLAWLGPEIGDREFAVEICAEVVHDADWEENVHSELVSLVSYAHERGPDSVLVGI